jgi:hypothetical protein
MPNFVAHAPFSPETPFFIAKPAESFDAALAQRKEGFTFLPQMDSYANSQETEGQNRLVLWQGVKNNLLLQTPVVIHRITLSQETADAINTAMKEPDLPTGQRFAIAPEQITGSKFYVSADETPKPLGADYFTPLPQPEPVSKSPDASNAFLKGSLQLQEALRRADNKGLLGDDDQDLKDLAWLEPPSSKTE